MLHKVPVNIITGFLGVGKTTAIQHLLEQKPNNEKWAVLVNEFGQVGIDQTAFEETNDVTIKELPGGCICCTLGLPFTTALIQLLQRSKPDRLIIEPTGIGHPAGIIDKLRREPFEQALDLQTTLCLVDARDLNNQKIQQHEIYQDQINIAEVIVINKVDVTDEDLIQQMELRLQQSFPAKAHIARAVQSKINPSLLDLGHSSPRANFASSHEHSHNYAIKTNALNTKALKTRTPKTHQPPTLNEQQSNEQQSDELQHPSPPPSHQLLALPKQPIVKSGEGYGIYSYGWVFHRDDCFALDQLKTLIAELFDPYDQFQLERLKAAVHVGKQWLLINQIGQEQSIQGLSWRSDSRLEIITTKPLDVDQLSPRLMRCLVN